MDKGLKTLSSRDRSKDTDLDWIRNRDLIEKWINDDIATQGLFNPSPEEVNAKILEFRVTKAELYYVAKIYFEEYGISFQDHFFSFYKQPAANTIPYAAGGIGDVYELIKSPAFKQQTADLRKIQNKPDARKFKAKHFDYCTFAGEFTKRNESGLISRSGLICLDLDDLLDINTVKTRLIADPLTELLFTSPSGNGLKWIVAVNIKFSHKDLFKGLTGYLRKKYQLEADDSGSDVCRACFLPHDPEIFINPKYLKNGVR